MGVCGPSTKGVWNKRRNPVKLSDKARSNQHIVLRRKGLPLYPASDMLIDSSLNKK